MRPRPHLTARGRRSGPPAVCGVAWAMVTLLVVGVSPLGAQEFPTDVTEYAAIRGGMTSFETPEVFELANIILSLTPAGQDRNSTFQGTPYYEAVRAQFGPFADHPVVAAVEYVVRQRDIQRYYNFRDNAFRFCFGGDDRIVPCTPYPPSYPLPDGVLGAWDAHIDEIEDFARVTGFRRFYAEQGPFYRGLVDSYRARVDLDAMRRWLEAHFSARWDSFRIVFSPLVAASHSAHMFVRDEFSEAVMLTASPPFVESYVEDPDLRRPELARMLFTELDHLYVNPATDRHQSAVEAAFADRAFWSGDGAGRYHSAYLVFNEYMTWAVFLLWAEETYRGDVFEKAVDWVVQAMIGYRGFPRFPDFFEALHEMRSQAPAGTRIEDLYPELLTWAERYYRASTEGAGGDPPEGTVDMDLPFVERGGHQQQLDLFTPRGPGFPTILFVHGGGLTSGDRKDAPYARMCRTFQAAGIACATTNYRLAPAHRWPTQPNDVVSALRWVKENIGARGGDDGRIFLFGHSSGCLLVSIVAADPRYLREQGLGPEDIAGVIAMGCRLNDYVEVTDAPPARHEASWVPPNRVDEYMERESLFGSLEERNGAVPAVHVSEHMPPTLVLIAEGERFFPPILADAAEFVGRALARGAEADLAILADRRHLTAIRMMILVDDPAVAKVIDFVRGH